MWTNVKIKLKNINNESLKEVISSYLFDCGAYGVEEKGGELRASFHSSKANDIFRKSLSIYLKALKKDFSGFSYRVRVSEVKSTNWAEKWKKYFKPEKVSKNFVIKPSWEPYKALKGETVIEINPGMAFGTGLHPTTRMVLKGIEMLVEKGKIETDKASFLDVGTGTGILAIAAKKLGFRKVKAIDIDGEALKAAKENILLNSLNGEIELSFIDISKIVENYNLVAANITAGEIMEIWGEIDSKVKEGGFLILSGILKNQEEEFLNGILSDKLRLAQRFKQKEWSAFILKKEL